MKPIPLLGPVCQLGLVVAKLESVVEHYRTLFDLDAIHINQVDTARGIGSEFTLHGKPIAAKARIAWFNLGPLEFELIEPLDEQSIYAGFLREHGPGTHHTMFTSDDFGAAARRLAEQGFAVLASGKLQQTRFQLFDTLGALGLICELADGEPLHPDERLVWEADRA